MRTTRNKEEERKRILLILGGSVLVTAALGVLAYLEYGKVKSVRSETDSVHGQIQAAESKRRLVPDLERDVIVLRENVAEYVKILPDDREINDFVTRINRFADESGVIVTSLEDVVRRAANRKNKDPFERVVYKIHLSGDVDEFMHFLSAFENHERFVNIPLFSVKAGRANEGDLKVRHDIEMQIETFVYNAGGGSVPHRVDIMDYERKRDRFENEIIEARRDVSIEQYAFQKNTDRRDPFLDPRISAADAEAQEIARQEDLLHELQEELEAIEAALAAEASEKDLLKKSELRHRTDGAIRGLAARLHQSREEKWFTVAAIVEKLAESVEVPFHEIVRERGMDPSSHTTMSLEDLVAARDETRALFDESQFDEVISKVESLIPRIDPVEKSEEFLAVLDEITQLREHASAILEFQQRTIEIEGIVFRPDGSAAIINGMVLAAGDPVDDEVIIAMIHEDEIEFHFRNIRISKLVHQ